MEIAAARCRLDNRAADPFGDDDIRRCTANRYQGGLRGRCRQVGAGQLGRIVRLNEPDPRAFGHAALQTRNPKAAMSCGNGVIELPRQKPHDDAVAVAELVPPPRPPPASLLPTSP